MIMTLEEMIEKLNLIDYLLKENEQLKQRLESLEKRRIKNLYNKSEIRKIYKRGNETIDRWVAMGVKEIPDGKEILYDIREIEEVLKGRAI